MASSQELLISVLRGQVLPPRDYPHPKSEAEGGIIQLIYDHLDKGGEQEELAMLFKALAVQRTQDHKRWLDDKGAYHREVGEYHSQQREQLFAYFREHDKKRRT